MISGSVDSEFNAIVPLRIRGEHSSVGIDAIIDTGFCDWLTLPPDYIESLGLEIREEGRYLMADGSLTVSRLFNVEIEWFGQWTRVLAAEIQSHPLLGMGMLRNCLLNIEATKGGRVRITPLPA